MLRRGRRHSVPVSAIVDTDDTVITFLTPSPLEILDSVLSETAEGGLLDVAEATAYLGGNRAASIATIAAWPRLIRVTPNGVDPDRLRDENVDPPSVLDDGG
jgi:hypothetical protein